MKSAAENRFSPLRSRAQFLIALVFLFALLTFAFIRFSHSVSAPEGVPMIQDAASWRIEIETSGGFSGKGVGGVSVSSDRQVSASSEARRACKSDASSEEIKAIEKLISQTKPRQWRKSYARPGNPRGYADQFLYTLKMSITKTGGAQSYETSWYDETRDTLPHDLDSLVKELWKIRDRVIAKC